MQPGRQSRAREAGAQAWPNAWRPRRRDQVRPPSRLGCRVCPTRRTGPFMMDQAANAQALSSCTSSGTASGAAAVRLIALLVDGPSRPDPRRPVQASRRTRDTCPGTCRTRRTPRQRRPARAHQSRRSETHSPHTSASAIPRSRRRRTLDIGVRMAALTNQPSATLVPAELPARSRRDSDPAA
jgi:hypothetical protein